MEEAMNIIIKIVQAAVFGEELERLSLKTPVHKSSPLASLNPFLDECQIMRVGGRLEQSTLPFKAKHPAILPHNHSIVGLLMQKLHEENRHCGPQALLAASRTQFWITNGKSLARSTVHKCIRCTRARPALFKQLMGNLPADRVTPARPFITTGVDYFGPIWIHHKIRGKRPDKAYIAVFCCFATKAVHMEVVSNLSTEAFIGALRCFISRRGHCQTL
ncbi:hypothetical protein EVAR_71381_1 [Eumeta japonica]|uniref:Integrase zinc-binding domain-containing protein n=1 Tax=Eumeta variegata TaxID=151549 RepID=A0A4C1SBA1_EUMVA|nr:hypothetical protein EVAR_71381_1 [Eumeta japonica]